MLVNVMSVEVKWWNLVRLNVERVEVYHGRILDAASGVIHLNLYFSYG